MAWALIASTVVLGYAELVAAVIRTERTGHHRHARFWSAPRPHRILMTGRHAKLYEPRHAD